MTRGRNVVDKFAEEIDRVVVYFTKEFNITYAEAIGVLHLTIAQLEKDALSDDEEDES